MEEGHSNAEWKVEYLMSNWHSYCELNLEPQVWYCEVRNV